ncbi:ROK family transcriptional regulator [Kineococcus sp. SYSU DK002]|uniref:ROK family transcriptional regulator n=1 Tax=Kineococcus sp. SYSU DK002 TaxID=3383123 RepID=UPI003D7CAEB9
MRARLLDLVRASGPISRVEMARVADLAPASVTKVVRALIEEGLIQETGQAESTGGKRRTLLEIAPEARYAVGIHLSAGVTTYALTDMAGGMIGRRRTLVAGSSTPQEAVSRMAQEVISFIDDLAVPRERTIGIGVAGSGPVDLRRGLLRGSGLADAARFPLRDALAERTGMTVLLGDEAGVAATGEFWGSGAEQPDAFACLYMGRHLSAGVVSGGMPVRGATSNAGQIGHVSVDPNGAECYCGNRGCLELYAAPAAVLPVRAPGPEPDDFSDLQRFDAVARAAVRGDAVASAALRSSLGWVASAAVALVNLTDVELIVLAGPAFAIAGALYVQEIREAVQRRAYARAVHPVQVRLATNPRDAAALGASALVLQHHLTPRERSWS